MSRLGTIVQVGGTFGVRHGMLRLEYELERGSGVMSRRMRAVRGWDCWNLKRIAPHTSLEEIAAARRSGTQKLFFTDPRALRTTIESVIGVNGRESVLAEAEGVLSGNLPYFGQLSFACGFPPRWFENPTTGQCVSPQQPWTQIRFASSAYGDLKFILEPSRFLFVYPLIRAYALTDDERYPRAFWHAIEDWACQSPPMTGPLWICGQECSLRILAWSFGLHAFIHSPSTTNQRVALLISMIAAHAWRTAQTLGYARSQRSNHLISEAVGLWTAGTLYPELKKAEAWKNLGADLLHEAVLDQITPLGVSHQHSFNYQRMILHLSLWTLRLAEIHDVPLPEGVRVRTQAAFDFIRSWVDPTTGSVPNYGSNDGSLIFPLAPGSYHDYRPLLQLGAAVLNRPAIEQGPWDEAALWFGVKPSLAERSDNLPASSVDTGYFRLGDKNSWALIRAGRYNRRPFHSDQLHVDLWWHGINLALDAGTYLYNGAPPWNNGLAGASIHNTLTVDHRDHMRRAGRFLWVDWAQASGRLSSSPGSGRADRFEGEHDGYKNIGVKHHRTVQWLHGAGWVIVDDVVGSGEHDLRLHWLAADLPYELFDSPFQVIFTAQQSRIRWSICSSLPASVAVCGMTIRAGKQSAQPRKGTALELPAADAQMFGWESPTYAALKPAVSLLYHTRAPLPARIVTAVLTGECYDLETINGHVAIVKKNSLNTSQDRSEIFRVSLFPNGSHAAEVQPQSGVPRA
jgi:hypothetical protein